MPFSYIQRLTRQTVKYSHGNYQLQLGFQNCMVVNYSLMINKKIETVKLVFQFQTIIVSRPEIYYRYAFVIRELQCLT